MYRSPGYDPSKHFSGVVYVGNAGFVIAVPGTLGVASLQNYIKAKPSELNYSSAGNGGATHLAMASFLAYTGARRSPLLPDLPTTAEAGAPGYKYDTWFGILAPRNMPQDEIDKIHAPMEKVLADATVQARLTRLGIDSEQMSAEAFNTLLRKDFEAAGPLVKASGANIE